MRPRDEYTLSTTVCLLAADYDHVVDLVLAALAPEDRGAVMGKTATRVYGLAEPA